MRGKDLIPGEDYGCEGGYYGRFRMIRLEVPSWGGPRQVLMQRLHEETGEPFGDTPTLVRPQEVSAPWEQFCAAREARAAAMHDAAKVSERVRDELTARGIGWSFGEWHEGRHRISLDPAELAVLLGIREDASALEALIGDEGAGR